MAATQDTYYVTSSADIYYQALLAHDSRFDGVFFVGVSTTGIYCRPICRVRMPKQRNCQFFQNPAAAERAGFRPCRKCRPELAPGQAPVDNGHKLAQRAARLIDADFLQNHRLTGLANELGTTDRHMRRTFQEYWGVTPTAYAQTHKLLLAKQLLTETNLPVTAIAFAAGFGSIASCNALFQKQYHLTPSQLRQHKFIPSTNVQTLRVAYRPPFAWEALLDFLAGRAIAGVELVQAGSYTRTISICQNNKHYEGWVRVQNDLSHSQLQVSMPDTLTPVIGIILARVRHLCDTACRPDIIAAALGELADNEPGLRLPGAFDGFEMAVRAIVGQQISVRAAQVIIGRIAGRFGRPISSPYPSLRTIFPDAETLARSDPQQLINCGLYGRRANSIQALAQACRQGLILEPSAEIDSTLQTLRSLPGIGEWTAQYIAMRALGRPDAFPHTDYAIKKALAISKPTEVLQRAEIWRPWRAYAATHIWYNLRPISAVKEDI